MKKLIIAEKPSLGRNIATALALKERRDGYIEGRNHIVSWAFGHLFKLSDVDDYFGKKMKWKDVKIPFIPKKFQFRLKEGKGVLEQFNILKFLINRSDVDIIVNCGDADREGQIIVDRIIKESKTGKDVYRLWLPEQTEETIKKELKNIKSDSEFLPLAKEGYSRMVMDWLLGINLTRYITLKTGQLMPVGRVLIPVLKFIYDRDLAISSFNKEKYIQLESECEKDKVKFKLIKSTKYNMIDQEKIDIKCSELNSHKGIVISKDKNEIKKQPNKLFSLSKLQSYLSKKNKIDFKKSLDVIQKLYENGYITYPRTNTEYLAENEKGKVKELLKLYEKHHNVIFKDSKKIFDDKKIESHSAIIPTLKIPKNALNSIERTIYDMIVNRFLSNFINEDTVTEKVVIVIGVGKERFKLSGESIKKVGFYRYEPTNFEFKLPRFIENDEIDVAFKKVEKASKPPRKVSERELANYLKNPFRKDSDTEEDEYIAILKGIEIGTEATRTGIIENAKKYEYISQKKSNFSLEPLGKTVIETLDKLNIDLYKTKTVEFSKLLKKVYKEKSSIYEIITLVSNELENIISQNIEIPKIYNDSDREIIATCPRCGKNIYENSKGYYCVGYRESIPCRFTLWKENRYFNISISKTVAKKLIKGETVLIKNLKNRNGEEYMANVEMEDTKKYVNLKIKNIKTKLIS